MKRHLPTARGHAGLLWLWLGLLAWNQVFGARGLLLLLFQNLTLQRPVTRRLYGFEIPLDRTVHRAHVLRVHIGLNALSPSPQRGPRPLSPVGGQVPRFAHWPSPEAHSQDCGHSKAMSFKRRPHHALLAGGCCNFCKKIAVRLSVNIWNDGTTWNDILITG